MKKCLFAFSLLALSMTVAEAQKYGHLNFGNLVVLMPEAAAADEALEAYQKELVAKGEEMAATFQEEYGAFVVAVQSGEVPPKDQQARQQALQQKQQEIVAYEQELIQKVQQKRQELLAPIVEKAEKAIAEVAKENGYVMIFDTSSFNAILFAQDSDDVMPLVKAKLGIAEE